MPPSASLGSPQMHVAHPPEILILMKYTPKIFWGEGGVTLCRDSEKISTLVSQTKAPHTFLAPTGLKPVQVACLCVFCVFDVYNRLGRSTWP
jgi:hypothetical protein